MYEFFFRLFQDKNGRAWPEEHNVLYLKTCMRKMLIKFIAQENNHNTSNWGGELRIMKSWLWLLMAGITLC